MVFRIYNYTIWQKLYEVSVQFEDFSMSQYRFWSFNVNTYVLKNYSLQELK